jgi:uncharacterized protein
VCEHLGVAVLVFILGFLFLAVSAFGATYPAYHGFVNDNSHLLSPQAAQKLEQELQSYEQKTTNEVAVVTVDTTGKESIEEYAVHLEEQWKVGKEGKDNGILFVVAKNDRKMRIEVGYGLEGVMTDGDAGEIIRNVVAPSFREGNYEKGIVDGTHAILTTLGDAPSDIEKVVGNNPVRRGTGSALDSIISAVGPFIFFIPMVLVYVVSYMARTKDATLGGILGGVGGGLLGLALGTIGNLLAFLVLGGVIGFIFDLILSRNYQQRIRRGASTDWFTTWGGFRGGSGWGGGSSGGGFGGFGGGRSGGGGSSGGW